jgi:hypothetical protein
MVDCLGKTCSKDCENRNSRDESSMQSV